VEVIGAVSDEPEAIRAEGHDPDDAAVMTATALVRRQLSLYFGDQHAPANPRNTVDSVSPLQLPRITPAHLDTTLIAYAPSINADDQRATWSNSAAASGEVVAANQSPDGAKRVRAGLVYEDQSGAGGVKSLSISSCHNLSCSLRCEPNTRSGRLTRQSRCGLSRSA
jgi:hypothetical protein